MNFRTLIPSISVIVKKVGQGGPAQQMWMTAKDIPAKMEGNVQTLEQMLLIVLVKLDGKVEGHFNHRLFNPKLQPQTFQSWPFQP